MKFLWLYTAILFSFALILIIFAGLTQNNFQKEIDQLDRNSKGLQKNMEAISAENTNLKAEIKTISENLEIAQTENTDLKTYKENSEKIFEAYQHLNKGRTESAVSTIQNIDTDKLTPPQLYLYKIIMEY